jgi:hypothetical protein
MTDIKNKHKSLFEQNMKIMTHITRIICNSQIVNSSASLSSVLIYIKDGINAENTVKFLLHPCCKQRLSTDVKIGLRHNMKMFPFELQQNRSWNPKFWANFNLRSNKYINIMSIFLQTQVCALDFKTILIQSFMSIWQTVINTISQIVIWILFLKGIHSFINMHWFNDLYDII